MLWMICVVSHDLALFLERPPLYLSAKRFPASRAIGLFYQLLWNQELHAANRAFPNLGLSNFQR